MNFGLVNRMANLAIRNSSCLRSQISRSSPSALPFSSLSGTSSVSLSQNLNQFQTQTITTTRQLSMVAPARSSSSAPLESMQEDGTVIATGPDGTKYSIPLKPLGNYNQKRHAPKIAPRIVRSRTSKLRTVDGKNKNIRHSPWRLNLVCQFAAGQTVNDALMQLQFLNKVKAPLVRSLIHGTANSAKMKYGLLPSQLEVAECFATQGTHLKRIKRMGRGRAGKMYRRFSHVRVVLREIDFPLKIMQCTSVNQRKKWVERMESALRDQAAYRKEREEIEALEREVEEMKRKKEAESKSE